MRKRETIGRTLPTPISTPPTISAFAVTIHFVSVTRNVSRPGCPCALWSTAREQRQQAGATDRCAANRARLFLVCIQTPVIVGPGTTNAARRYSNRLPSKLRVHQRFALSCSAARVLARGSDGLVLGIKLLATPGYRSTVDQCINHIVVWQYDEVIRFDLMHFPLNMRTPSVLGRRRPLASRSSRREASVTCLADSPRVVGADASANECWLTYR